MRTVVTEDKRKIFLQSSKREGKECVKQNEEVMEEVEKYDLKDLTERTLDKKKCRYETGIHKSEKTDIYVSLRLLKIQNTTITIRSSK